MELATDVTADALVQVKREKEAPELPSHVADAAKAGDLEAVKAWLAQPTADINAEDAPSVVEHVAVRDTLPNGLDHSSQVVRDAVGTRGARPRCL